MFSVSNIAAQDAEPSEPVGAAAAPAPPPPPPPSLSPRDKFYLMDYWNELDEKTFADALLMICRDARDPDMFTETARAHPVVGAFLTKLAALSPADIDAFMKATKLDAKDQREYDAGLWRR